MKKKILFVIPSLRSGGAEKSLITLLSLMNYEKYDIDLLCFRQDGLFYEKIPQQVYVIKDTENYEMFDGDAKAAMIHFLKKGRISSVIDRFKYANSSLSENERWELLKKQLPNIEEKYDCAIGYLEGNASYFVAENIQAERKICYVHNDFKKLGLDKEKNRKLFERCDKVVTVSDVCLESLKAEFPSLCEKFVIIENITSPKIINEYAKEETPYENDKDRFVLTTVGRLAPQKAIDLAVKASAILKDKGYNFRWYHIGTGSLKEETESLISSLGVENEFVLLGERANPYPYIGQCDIYVQPSRYEGKSIAIDEAKCLCKPIVTTNFTTVADQIQCGVNGLICEMDETDIAEKIEALFNDEALRKQLSVNLANEKTGNEEELEKFYAILK